MGNNAFVPVIEHMEKKGERELKHERDGWEIEYEAKYGSVYEQIVNIFERGSNWEIVGIRDGIHIWFVVISPVHWN